VEVAGVTQPEMMRGPAGGRLTEEVRQQALDELLNPEVPKSNVIGFGHGIKWTDGLPTGEEATLVFVTQKVPESGLSERDVIPRRMADGTPTDVVALGYLTAQQLLADREGVAVRHAEPPPAYGRLVDGRSLLEAPAPAEVSPQLLRRRMRPCPSGASIGNVAITAGTLGSVVYDYLPGATTSPPGGGIGVPSRFYVLSNNHVLADSNNAPQGSAIVQPGPFDGGVAPQDVIARLSRFIPIQFSPQVPLAQHNNVVDAAIGECDFADATRETYFSGAPRAWRRKANVAVGDLIKKTGRTTNFSVGRIISVDATVDVGYGAGRVARFRDQIVTTNMSAGGDSGSLVTSLDNVAVGLLFAGSSVATIVNHFENVRALLRIEVAETLA
jgi:hypothetical protein